MRIKIFIFITLLFIITGCGSTAGVNESRSSQLTKADDLAATSALKGSLENVRMINTTIGWADSWYFSANADSRSYIIWRTTDAGMHWKAVLTCAAAQAGIQNRVAAQIVLQNRETAFETCPSNFYSALVATVLQPEPGNQSRIFHTSDGGQTWQSAVIGAQHMNTAPIFVDGQHGWYLATSDFPGFDPSSAFMGKQIALYRTTDGGQTWQHISSGDAFGTAPLTFDTKMTFIDAETGWMAGNTYTGSESTAWLYITHDAGTTWHQIATAFPKNSLIMGIPDLFTKQDGLLPVLTSGPAPKFTAETMLYTTHDGGKTWENTAAVPFDLILNAGDFIDLNHGWAVADKKTFYVTNDGWRHWSRGQIDTTFKNMRGFNFISPLVGWALGNTTDRRAPVPGSGPEKGDIITLLKTTDGGHTWRAIAHSTV